MPRSASTRAPNATARHGKPFLLNPAPAAGERRAPDVGFRVFKLASSNIREWDPQRDRLAESLEAAVDHLKTDRTEQDILYELLLKLGLDLCVPIAAVYEDVRFEPPADGGSRA